MKQVMRFDVNGETDEVTRDELDEYQRVTKEHGDAPNEIQTFRMTGADGRSEDVDVPTSEMEDFRAAAEQNGEKYQRVMTMQMDDGSRQDMTGNEVSRYLRSDAYRKSPDYKPPEQGSPALAGAVGGVGGFFAGLWHGGNAAANAIAKAIPEIGIEVENAIGTVANGFGFAPNAVGNYLQQNAASAKTWLDEKLPSEAKEWTGYEDWSTKVSDKIGQVAAMAYKFAPAMATMPAEIAAMGTQAARAAGAKVVPDAASKFGPFMETVFGSDGVNAYADMFAKAKDNGASDIEAAEAGGTAFLINYFGGKLMMRAGGVAEGIESPIAKFMVGGAAVADTMGVQAAANRAVENVATGQPVAKGTWDAFQEGAVEGWVFHGMNAVPGAVLQGFENRAARIRYNEMARREILEKVKTSDGAAQLAVLMDTEAIDRAISARKAELADSPSEARTSGLDVKALGIAAGLPETMTKAEMIRVLDAVSQQRQAQAERVRTRMDDVQAEALAETIQKSVEADVSAGNLAADKEAQDVFEKTWLKAVEKVGDASVLDDPELRDKIVGEAYKAVRGDVAAAKEAERAEKSRIRGSSVADQMGEIEKRGIESWEDAEADGLIGKDERGRWSGGMRTALNIAINGTDKLKTAVKDGVVSGPVAEDLVTVSYCELGGRTPEERAALVDRILDLADGNEAMARRMMDKIGQRDAADETPLLDDLKRVADEVTVEMEREIAEGLDPTSGGAPERQPATAYEGAVNAERMKGTELHSREGAVMGCERFPEVRVEISQEGIVVEGLTDELMSRPENAADAAALLKRLSDIAERNGLTVDLGDANAKTVADGIMDEINRGGLEATQRKMDTRAQLFNVLAKTTLGNGVTFDEASFKAALEKTGNGRQFVDSHGGVYGFVDAEGVIHFNPTAINYNTPIHEYGHLALEAVKKVNGAFWQRGIDLVKESSYYRDLLTEIERDKDSPYAKFSDEQLRDEALARMIGDRGERLVETHGLEAKLKEWLKEFWKTFKGALGVADLTEEQIEKMSLGDFVGAINAELLRGKEFGSKKAVSIEKRSIKRFDEDQNSGSNGLLRWKNDRGYLFAIPVDMERTQLGGRIVLATDDANVTDWIQNALNGVELRMSRTGKLYVKGRDGLDGELAEIFGRYPTIGQNDGIFEQIASETGNRAMNGAARDMTPEALVEALRADRESYDAWKQGRDVEAERLADEQAHDEWLAQQRWENSGMSVADYVRNRVEEGDPEFDLDWETAREIERDRAAGRLAIKRSANGEEYSYAALSTKPDMTLTPIDPNRFRNYGNKNGKKISDAKKSIIDAGGFVRDGHYYITLDGEEVEVGSRAITHGIHNLNNEMIFPVLGNVIKNAVKVNELNVREKFSGKGQKDENINAKFVYLGAAAYGNEILPVRIQIDQRNGFKKIESYDVLKSFNTKIGRIASQNKNAPLGVSISPNAPATISIANLIGIAQPLHPQIFSRDVSNTLGVPYRGNEIQAKFSVGRLYTGSAADYEKPSLLKVGTGEGSQVYGWGLYASSERGVAEGYANTGSSDAMIKNQERIYQEVKSKLSDRTKNKQAIEDIYEAVSSWMKWEDVRKSLVEDKNYEAIKVFEKNESALKKIHSELMPSAKIYEQTFFTNRAPGDESHLLKWYEPISEENLDRIFARLKKEAVVDESIVRIYVNNGLSGAGVYQSLEHLLGSPKAASEFLARADIDGIKYPVDSYGKTVKDGDKAGWNYVSFRDDNINVDHKWRDGQALFSVDRGRPIVNKSLFVAGRARVADPADWGEQTPGALAASSELSNQGVTPMSSYGAIRKMSLPLPLLEFLRKRMSDSPLPAHVAERMPGGKYASHSRNGQLYIYADVFGTVDNTDMAKEKSFLKQHGFFRNEDNNWCAGQLPNDIAREKRRSEDQLATQLLNLGSRRVRGQEPGGQEAARKVFADEVAKYILRMPQSAPGVLGKMQTIGKALRAEIVRQYGGAAKDAQDKAKQEAGGFLDWAYGGPLVDPATGNPVSRGDALGLNDLSDSMFGAWLVMPQEMERRAPNWSASFESTIAVEPKLADAFREMTMLGSTEQATGYIMDKLKAQQKRSTEEALKQLWWESREPISAGSKVADAKETLLVGFHDKFAPVYVRVDEKVKNYVKAEKDLLKKTVSAVDRAAIRQEIDRFTGEVGRKMHKLELSRTAYERGAWNEGRRYFMQMALLENKATEKWGLSEEDKSLYLQLQRVIETQGKAGSFGMTARNAQIGLDEMKTRLGAAKFAKLEQYSQEFFSIHEREILADARIERALGKSFVDYCRTQTHYVTTKRTFSPEELDAIETARAAVKQAGVAGGDDVITQMYAYAGARGAGSVIGEGAWLGKLKGSMAATQEVRSATWEKADPLMQFGRRNQMVLDLRDALVEAGVEGVRDMVRTDGTEFPSDPRGRYGHINYMENGQKRVLVVPRQISDAFRIDPDNAQWITKANGLVRSMLIDYNVAYWAQNVKRNQDSVEKNMQGMRETWLKTGLRGIAPGVAPIVDLVSQALVRKIPITGKAFRLLFGQHTFFAQLPKAERYAKILENPTAWQQELWKAEAAGNVGKVQQMNEDFAGVMEMLRGNFLVPTSAAYSGAETHGFAFDMMNKKGLKTLAQIEEENRTRSRGRKFVDKINVFKMNQAQQEHEDILAKTVAYLHDRANYAMQRSVAESGLMVKKNVSIAEGERSGRMKRGIQASMAQFFNMVEKGVVRHWKAVKERPGETLLKDGKVWIGRLVGMTFANGVLMKYMLDDDDVKGDEQKALGKYGVVYKYAKAFHTAYQNCSDYVKENYNFTPIWNSADGMTSVIIGGAMTDEDKLIVPSADLVASWIAHRQGIGPAPEIGKAIANSTFKAVTPDLQLAAPIVNFLRATVEATMIDNPTDYFRNAPMYDEKLWRQRNESWEMRGKFAAQVGCRLWNDFGGRALLAADVNGVDNGRGSAPDTLEDVLRKIPVLSPAIARMIKIQVGSPAKKGAAITDRTQRTRDVINLLAQDLLKRGTPDVGWHESHLKEFQEKLADWKETYGLTDADLGELQKKYYNAWIQRKSRSAYDQKALGQLFKEGMKHGLTEEQIWIQLGER